MSIQTLISVRGHTIFPSALLAGSTVIDCGSHRGEFAMQVLEVASVSVQGFEANPELFAILPRLKHVEFFHQAIAGSVGTATFSFQQPECGSIRFISQDNALVSVPCTTLEAHCKLKQIEHIGLLKLDIEGAELDVLENASPDFLKKIDQITVEFHDFLCPEDLPRIQACVDRLKKLGFYFFRMSFFTWGDCLLLNSHSITLSYRDIALILYHRYYSGFKRMTAKFIGRLVSRNRL